MEEGLRTLERDVALNKEKIYKGGICVNIIKNNLAISTINFRVNF